MLGKIESRRRRGQQRMRRLNGLTDSMDMNGAYSGEMVRTGKPGVPLSPWGHKESGMTERPNNKSLSEGEDF